MDKKILIKENFKKECNKLNNELINLLETDDKELGVKVHLIQEKLNQLTYIFLKNYYSN